MAKVCPVCGRKYDDDALFCGIDGTRLEEPTPPPPPPPPHGPDNGGGNGGENGGGTGIQSSFPTWLIAVLVVAVIVLIGIIAAQGREKAAPATPAPVQVQTQTFEPDPAYQQNSGTSYRKTNIGEVKCGISTDSYKGLKYRIPESPIENVVELTLSYQVTKVTEGTGAGKRYLYTQDCNGEWYYATEFDYYSGQVTKTVTFDEPRDIYAYILFREQIDVSNYQGESRIYDIWVEDYNY